VLYVYAKWLYNIPENFGIILCVLQKTSRKSLHTFKRIVLVLHQFFIGANIQYVHEHFGDWKKIKSVKHKFDAKLEVGILHE
jgi:hypothetical protein